MFASWPVSGRGPENKASVTERKGVTGCFARCETVERLRWTSERNLSRGRARCNDSATGLKSQSVSTFLGTVANGTRPRRLRCGHLLDREIYRW